MEGSSKNDRVTTNQIQINGNHFIFIYIYYLYEVLYEDLYEVFI